MATYIFTDHLCEHMELFHGLSNNVNKEELLQISLHPLFL